MDNRKGGGVMDEVTIYIADQRGETTMGAGTVRSTLNYERYVSPHRLPIAGLQHVNEWTMDAEEGVTLLARKNTVTLLLPLMDGMLLQIDGQQHTVLVGHVFVWKAEADTSVHITTIAGMEGPFSFQELVLSTPIEGTSAAAQYSLPIIDPQAKNNMLPVLQDAALPFQLYVGAFLGKSEFLLQPASEASHFFALALDGNFEVEERLLFSSDALALTNYAGLDIECLSATGILLVLHF